jgi:hypothetical protein
VAEGPRTSSTAHLEFTSNETWSRLNADPMLMMKRVEIGRRKNAVENARVLKTQLLLQKRAADKLHGGKAKKSKKEKKDKREKSRKAKRKKTSDRYVLDPSTSFISGTL